MIITVKMTVLLKTILFINFTPRYEYWSNIYKNCQMQIILRRDYPFQISKLSNRKSTVNYYRTKVLLRNEFEFHDFVAASKLFSAVVKRRQCRQSAHSLESCRAWYLSCRTYRTFGTFWCLWIERIGTFVAPYSHDPRSIFFNEPFSYQLHILINIYNTHSLSDNRVRNHLQFIKYNAIIY